MDFSIGRRAAAEFVGAFALVFVGMAAISIGADLVGVAFAHGLAIAVMASAVGHISGGHFNPAVTFGFLVTRRIVPRIAAAYVVAQLLGAIAATLVLRGVFSPDSQLDPGVPQIPANVGVGSGLLVEIVLTFFLVWVIFATAADPRGTFKSIAGLAIGLTITMGVLAGAPFSGAAMNPARAFGPELVQGIWSDAWVYWIGPLVGAGIAALAYEYLYLRPLAPVPVGLPESGVDEPRPGDTAVS
jgi:aquaporin TIP